MLQLELHYPEDKALHFVRRFDRNNDGHLSSIEFNAMRRKITETSVCDFHRAMVATAAGEKLLIGRRPVRNWTQLHFFLCFAVFVQKSTFLLRKINKTAATRSALFDSNMYQIVCLLGLCPGPHWGSLQRSPRPHSCI